MRKYVLSRCTRIIHALDGMDCSGVDAKRENFNHELSNVEEPLIDTTGTHARYSRKTMTQAWEDSSTTAEMNDKRPESWNSVGWPH